LTFLDRFSKNNLIQNFIKIHSVGAELFHVDGRTDGQTDRQKENRGTDMTKLIIAFRNFVSTPINYPVDTFETSSYPSTKFPMKQRWKLWTLVMVKFKFSLEVVTKSQRGVQVYIYSFFNLSTRWVGGQRHAPAPLPPGKTRYPLHRRLGGPQGRSGRVRQISPPTGIRSPDRPARSESLNCLSHPGPPLWILWYDICGIAQ
jgi:hypothetical protein